MIEKPCRGDLIKNIGRNEPSGEVHDDLSLANQVNIVADPYAMEHLGVMRYLKFSFPKIGGVWKINSAELIYPRVKLELGGIYNGEQA